ncbi:alpha/beta fold hydrolase [Rhodovulum sp. DZ06]|uniref:alpha/beta fold hydrolase n=1 Tax=Rhodovulum sp. DZ06 TaxID=3425126 RepID=UPI003D33F9F8
MAKDKTQGGASGAAVQVFSTGASAYAQPRRFADMLDQWGEQILSLGPREAETLNKQLEAMLEQTAPMMEKGREHAWISAELTGRLAQEKRPAAVFAETGALLARNAAAELRLEIADNARLSDLAHERADGQRLADLLRAAREGAAAPAGPVVAMLNAAGGETMLAELTVETASDDGRPLILMRGLDLTVSEAALDKLAEAYGLTEAERAIAALSARGFSPAEISAWRDTSVETVRTQLKTLREKTGARSQMEILRLVAGLAPLAEEKPAVRDYAMPRRHGLVRLSGGRRMEYVRIGPENGRPILVLHAVLFGFRWPEALVNRLNEAGFTLYFPVRPGYGLSSRTQNETGFEDEVRDLAEFVDQMGFETYEVVGQGVSAGVAAALAERHHNRVSAIAGISGYLPISLDEFFADMTPWQRTVLHVARSAPKLIRITSMLAGRMMRKIGAQEFYSRTFCNSAADTAVIRNPETLRLLSANLDLLRAQDLNGISTDFPRIMVDWEERWKSLRTPGLQIHGDDRQVFDPEKAAALCDRHPAVRFEMVRGGGQMLAYSHPERVADLLISHFLGR